MREQYPQQGYGIIVNFKGVDRYLTAGNLQHSKKDRVYLDDKRFTDRRLEYLKSTGYFEAGEIPRVEYFDFAEEANMKRQAVIEEVKKIRNL